MRKDKKAGSRICGKICLENRTVSSSLKESISAESVSHAGKRRRELLAVFCVLVSESSVIMDTRPCKAGIPDAATKQSFAVHLVWLTVLHRAGSDNCRQTCGQLKLCPAAAWEGERQSLTSQARPDKLQSSCTVMKYYKEANSETDCEYQP